MRWRGSTAWPAADRRMTAAVRAQILASMTPAAAPGFLPSRDGFAFTNSWPAAPAIRVRTPLGSIGIGNAAAGLCGGMVFAALDFWHAETVPPAQRPAPGSPLYRFVVRRLVDSWHIPAGIARYYRWMNLPDGDSSIDLPGRRPAARRGVAWRTIVVHWPRIKASLDDGIPAALGLVTMASANPLELGHNHQVLAFGYTLSDNKVTIAVYDRTPAATMTSASNSAPRRRLGPPRSRTT
jgi:hypothetical protein